jgi:hypothetical protein
LQIANQLPVSTQQTARLFAPAPATPGQKNRLKKLSEAREENNPQVNDLRTRIQKKIDQQKQQVTQIESTQTNNNAPTSHSRKLV